LSTRRACQYGSAQRCRPVSLHKKPQTASRVERTIKLNILEHMNWGSSIEGTVHGVLYLWFKTNPTYLCWVRARRDYRHKEHSAVDLQPHSSTYRTVSTSEQKPGATVPRPSMYLLIRPTCMNT